jgi:hypothetical protein
MWRKVLAVTISAALSGACSFAAPDPPKCKGNAKLVGDCFTIHGRMQAGNGTPSIRIWRVGTQRMLGVPEGDEDGDPDVASLPDVIYKTNIRDQAMFADFVVCPLTKEKPGAMQMVCVESATHLVLSGARPQKKEQ